VLQNHIRFTENVLNPLTENPAQIPGHFHPKRSLKKIPADIFASIEQKCIIDKWFTTY